MRFYGLPPTLFMSVGRDLLRGQPRSLLTDSRALLAALPSAPNVTGREHIPPRGGCLLIFNHYERPGLWIGLFGALLVDAVARARGDEPTPVVFLVTDRVPVRLGRWTFDFPTSRFFLTRAAALWQMLPLSADPRAVMGRGHALRRALARVRAGGVLALAPEGAVRGDRGLHNARPGSGLFMQWVSRYAPIVPIGLWEADERLHVRIGRAFHLRDASDMQAGCAALGRIAELLPNALRGAHPHQELQT